MRAYIIRRLILIIPTILVVTISVFLSIRAVPGSVVEVMVSQRQFATSGELTIAELEHALGLDVPVHIQYIRWLGDVFRGDLGESLWSDTSVADEIASRLPISIELGLIALIIGQMIAIPIGVISAIRQDTIGDYVGRIIAIGFMCVPGFWIATLLMVFPSRWWGWAPPMEYVPFLQDPLKNLSVFIIPGLIMGLTAAGGTMRLTRSMMLEVLRQDYIRTAWSKGLQERVIVLRHALKNAMIPVITVIGMSVPVIVGGTVIMEQIFNLPGMGRLLLNALNTRDYTMISGTNLFIAIFILAVNLLVDLSYGFFNPRVRYG